MGVPLGNTLEDHYVGAGRPTTPSEAEKIKSFKDDVQDTSRKARDRAKLWGRSIFKLDRHEEALSATKRQKTDVLLDERFGGANVLEMPGQTFCRPRVHPLEKPEDKTNSNNNFEMKKRIRISLPDPQVGGLDGILHIEEKISRMPAGGGGGGGGWDRKMKRKRSNYGKPNAKPKLQPRSKASKEMSGTHSSVETLGCTNSVSHTASRSDLEGVPPPMDQTTLAEEIIVANGDKKTNTPEIHAGSSSIINGELSGTPRSFSVAILDSSDVSGAQRGSNLPKNSIKTPALRAINYKKHPIATIPSASNVAHWVGQRPPPKIMRTTPADLVSTVPPAENMGNLLANKRVSSVRQGSEKNTSRSRGRPSKKMMAHKNSVCCGQILNGELDADHQELLVAATSARSASYRACSDLFWKKMEGYFGPITSLNESFLEQQVMLYQMYGDENKSPSIFQRILSAFIDPDEVYLLNEIDESHCRSCDHNESGPKDRDRMDSEVESEVHLPAQNHGLLDRISQEKSVSPSTDSNRSISSSVCYNEPWQADDDVAYSDSRLVSQTFQDLSCNYYSDWQYGMMSSEERLMLELRSIGLCPETVPNLAEGVEAINRDIVELEAELLQEVRKIKNSLAKIHEAIPHANELERRNVEQVAMEKLIEMASQGRMACRGSRSSKMVIRRVSKRAALPFAARTLARCRKFEDTGRSCFSDDAALRDIIFSEPPCDVDPEPVGTRDASRRYRRPRVCKPDPSGSASGNGPLASPSACNNIMRKKQRLAKEEQQTELANLSAGQLNELGQLGDEDYRTLLDFEVDGVQDHDSLGLETPLDDLKDIQMFI